MVDFFFHPFSSYSQKVLIALHENEIAFNPRLLSGEDEATLADWEKLWPLRRFPVLHEGGRTIVEATTIIEYLDIHHRGPIRFIPDDQDLATEVRMRDRIFDLYVMTPVQQIVFDALRPEGKRDPLGIGDARNQLYTTYAWLDGDIAGREWSVGPTFTMADCAAAPALFYADWVHPIGKRFPNLLAYRKRLNARPSFARCIDEGRPYRHLFPLGAPDRD